MIRILVDVNLSPTWTPVLSAAGWDTLHWTTIGDPRAPDATVLTWAREHDRIVFTHDLDFGTLLALTQSAGPSVIQVRVHDVMPDALAPLVIATIRRYEEELSRGVLLTIDELDSRVRLLPIRDTTP